MDCLNNSSIYNKRILLLAPSVFGYQVEITTELTKLGAKVTYFDERPGNDFFSKVFLRLGLKFFIKKKINDHYKRIESFVEPNSYDFLLVINPEAISTSFLGFVKLKTDMKIYFYMWDSLKNKKGAQKLIPYSDRFFTFDPNDSIKYEEIRFLPLFYISDYTQVSTKDSPKYDLSFVGTIHSDRIDVVKKIKNDLNLLGKNFLVYYYSPSRILFHMRKLYDSGYKKINTRDVNFEYMKKKEVLDVFSDSRAILDIEHPSQTGLTMRTIESLGAKKKLITTNKHVKSYDFYNRNNIYVLDRNEAVVDLEFINSPYKSLEKTVYDKYSLTNWLMTIFDNSTPDR